jgi:hypothetical protein
MMQHRSRGLVPCTAMIEQGVALTQRVTSKKAKKTAPRLIWMDM